MIVSVSQQDVEFYVWIYISASTFWQNIPSCQNWWADLFGNGVHSTLSKTYTYLSYLLKQTDAGGEIAKWTQCPNKCLHVVQGQRSWATKPILLARWARHRVCVNLLLNAYWTIHLLFSFWFIVGFYAKSLSQNVRLNGNREWIIVDKSPLNLFVD